MPLISILNKILDSNSTSLVELEKMFISKFPNERAMHNLISGYVYSESVYKISEQALVQELESWLERRG